MEEEDTLVNKGQNKLWDPTSKFTTLMLASRCGEGKAITCLLKEKEGAGKDDEAGVDAKTKDNLITAGVQFPFNPWDDEAASARRRSPKATTRAAPCRSSVRASASTEEYVRRAERRTTRSSPTAWATA